MKWLFTLFIVVPLIELILLVGLGQLLGFWPTVLVVLVTGTIGAALARSQGLRALERWRDALRQGEAPELALASGLVLLVGSVLLITPGILTDVVGLACLFPVTRRTLAKALLRRVNASAVAFGETPMATGGFSFFVSGAQFQRGARDRTGVIDVASEETHRKVAP